ncbi:hypothetical protein PR048_026195 [Dryococelus australis]|uniref:Uncharacterized protein n=1 Tax=Dryococelus australis TaxID=614101 RepID=A0ABQ9GKQ0_9NEOP|nr:hypothetical protein PR048_026195 [Dryococelus australis]
MDEVKPSHSLMAFTQHPMKGGDCASVYDAVLHPETLGEPTLKNNFVAPSPRATQSRDTGSGILISSGIRRDEKAKKSSVGVSGAIYKNSSSQFAPDWKNSQGRTFYGSPKFDAPLLQNQGATVV